MYCFKRAKQSVALVLIVFLLANLVPYRVMAQVAENLPADAAPVAGAFDFRTQVIGDSKDETAWSVYLSQIVIDPNWITKVLSTSEQLSAEDLLKTWTRSNLLTAFEVFSKKNKNFEKTLCSYAADGQFPAKNESLKIATLAGIVETEVSNAAPVISLEAYKALWINRNFASSGSLYQISEKIRNLLKQQAAKILSLRIDLRLPYYQEFLVTQPSNANLDTVYKEQVLAELCKNSEIEKQVNSTQSLQKPILQAWLDTLLLLQQSGQRDSAIKKILSHAIQLWSKAFQKWDWASEERAARHYSESDALLCESVLHLLIQRLRQAPVGEMVPISKERCEMLSSFVDYCGGWWSDPDGRLVNSGTSAKPCWLRNLTPERQAKLDSIAAMELAPVSAQIAYLMRLKNNPEELSLVNADKVKEKSTSIQSYSAIAKSPLPWFVQSGTTENTPPNNSVSLFGLLQGQPETSVHQDLRRALMVVFAQFHQWRADIEYRRAGPRLETTDDSRYEPPKPYYECAKEELDTFGKGDTDSVWAVGYGLVGRVFETQADVLRDEVEARLLQLKSHKDFAGPVISWPLLYPWSYITAEPTAPIRGLIKYLEKAEGDAKDSIKEEHFNELIKASNSSHESAMHEAEVELLKLDAEEELFEQRKLEKQVAKIRVDASKAKEKQAENELEAANFLLKATEQEWSASTKKSEYMTLVAEAGAKQIQELRGRIQAFEPQFNNAVTKTKDLSDGVKQLTKELRQHQKDSNSKSMFFSILESVASAISVAFLGVDVVKIAKQAVMAFKAFESGDYSKALGYAFSAANDASGGELKTYVDEKLGEFKTFIADVQKDGLAFLQSIIPSSLKDLAEQIKALPDMIDAQASEIREQIWDVVSNTCQIDGIGKLCKEVTAKKFLESVGIAPNLINDYAKEVIRSASEDCVSTLTQAFRSQGLLPNLIVELGTSPENLEKELKKLAEEGLDNLEKTVTEKLKQIEIKGNEVVIAPFKAAIVRAHQATTVKLAEYLNCSEQVIENALSSLNQAASKVEQLAQLPNDVQTHINLFTGHLQQCMEVGNYLTSSSLRRQLMDQVEDYKSSDMDKLETQLNENVQTVNAELSKAAGAFNELLNLLKDKDAQQIEAFYHADEAKYIAAADRFRTQEKASSLRAKESELQIAKLNNSSEAINSEISDKIISYQEKIVGAQKEKEKSAVERVSEAAHRLNATKLSKDIWKFEIRTDLDESTRACLVRWRMTLSDYINKNIISAFRSLSVFEPTLLTGGLISTTDFPVFDCPNSVALTVRTDALVAAQNADFINNGNAMQLCSTTHLTAKDQTDLSAKMFDPKSKLLAGQIPQTVSSVPINAVKKIKEGFRFVLAPDGIPLPALTGPPVSRVVKWKLPTTLRLRILGVKLTIDGTSPGSNPIVVLKQEQSWIVKKDNAGVLQLVVLDIPLKEGQHLQPGWTVRGLETLPAFGVYSLKAFDSTEIKDSDNHKATLDFLVVGRNE